MKRARGWLGLLVAQVTISSPLESQSPVLVPIDTIWLQETSTVYLARPSFLSVDFDGGFYVSDLQMEQVVRYSRIGRIVGTYGRRGEGPGEFRSIAVALAVDDTTVAVAGLDPPVVNLYDREPRLFRQQWRINGQVRSGVAARGSILLGALNMSQQTGLVRLDPATGKTESLIRTPKEYVEGGPRAGIFNGVRVQPLEDSIVIGFAGVNYLLLADSAGSVADTIEVPVLNRQGVPPDVESLFRPGVHTPYPELLSSMSALRHLTSMENGTLLTVHADAETEGKYPRTPRDPPPTLRSRGFVSVVDLAGRRACVDGRLPMTEDAQPVVASAGDTLLVLRQHIDAGLDGAASITRYVLDLNEIRVASVAKSVGDARVPPNTYKAFSVKRA